LKKDHNYLPKGQTCFFELKVPRYRTKEELELKLNYAIENSQGPVEDNEQEGVVDFGDEEEE